MMSINEIEKLLTRMNKLEIIEWCMVNNLLLKELNCKDCLISMNFVSYFRNIDEFAWRCMNKKCISYKKCFSLRKSSFFENFNLDLLRLLKIILKYASGMERRAMITYFGKKKKDQITKVIK